MKKKKKRKLHKLVEGESLKSLQKKAWTEWSIFIRTKYADRDGFVSCFTCDKRMYWSQAHAGHFRHRKLNFNEFNIHPQCSGCNTYRGGRLDVYATRLVKKYGSDILETIDKLVRDEKPVNRLELKALIHALKTKNGESLKRLGLK